MQIKNFFDSLTNTFSYIIIDDESKNCAIIDSVLNYDIFSGKITYHSADILIDFIQKNNLHLEWILETHIHADHLTAAYYLQKKLGGKIVIGEGIFEVLEYWVKFFNIENEVMVDGSQFDKIFKEGEDFKIGNLTAKFIKTPGHTPACGSYIIEDAVFVGDLIFMPQLGTGRTDFPGGSAREMFKSIQKIFSLPKNTRIFTCHDYPLEGNDPQFTSTVATQKEQNILAKINSEEEYVKARMARDEKLTVPKLLLPSIQVNLRCGKLPAPESNGISYLKIPLSFN